MKINITKNFTKEHFKCDTPKNTKKKLVKLIYKNMQKYYLDIVSNKEKNHLNEINKYLQKNKNSK